MAKKYILTGGPGVGKSTILELTPKSKGIYLIGEVATYIIERELKKPESEQMVPWKNCYEFQKKVFELQKKWESEIPSEIEKALLDRGIIDNLAYLRLNNLQDSELYRQIEKEAQRNRYEKIFLLEPMPKREETEVRRDCELGKRIQCLIAEEYEKQGYKLEKIPAIPPIERRDIILKRIM